MDKLTMANLIVIGGLVVLLFLCTANRIQARKAAVFAIFVLFAALLVGRMPDIKKASLSLPGSQLAFEVGQTVEYIQHYLMHFQVPIRQSGMKFSGTVLAPSGVSHQVLFP
jgi:hypothetical protein